MHILLKNAIMSQVYQITQDFDNILVKQVEREIMLDEYTKKGTEWS